MNDKGPYEHWIEPDEQPSQHVKELLDLDLMHLAMSTLHTLHSLKAGASIPILKMNLESLVRIATFSLKDLYTETTKEP